MRLDRFLAVKYPERSRQYFQYVIDEGLVLINGQIGKKSFKLLEGDEVEVEFILTPEISLEPENIPLEILFEDEDLLVINKPAGMVVHPAAGNWSGTFVNALLYHCKQLEKGDTLRPGIVHRLDKDTTGVLLAAKNEKCQQKLIASFASREVEKQYLAICCGNPGNRLIEGNIGRHPTKRKEMALLKTGGKEARSRVETLSYTNQLSYVRLYPETGRTHQLRVHLKSLATPILGDKVYGSSTLNAKFGAQRQQLHAHKLIFCHPKTHRLLTIEAPLPADMLSFIALINRSLS